MNEIYYYTSMIYPSLSIGILLAGLTAFIFLYIKSKERLHLSFIIFSFFGLSFIINESLVMICYLVSEPELGRQFHRLQALSSLYFIFGIPSFAKHLLIINQKWQRLNNIIYGISILLFFSILISAFISPDLFVSQTHGGEFSINLRWPAVRGKTGILYIMKDIFLASMMIYMLILIIIDMKTNKRFKQLLFPLSGLLAIIITGFLDYMIIYCCKNYIDPSFLNFSFSTIGIGLFLIISMIGIFNQYYKQTKKIENLQKFESLSTFAGGIAHDFNNYLTAVIGNISLIHDDITNEQNRHALKDAEKALHNAKNLTQQLLTFSKNGTPLKEKSSIKKLLIDTVDFLTRGSNMKINYNIPDDLKAAEIDQGQISQAIQNIVLNSRDSMPHGGNLNISARNCKSVNNSSFAVKTVKIDITDTGIGIPQSMINRIFEPYFTTKKNGHGLGLAVTWSIIKKHGGKIEVTSHRGIGTTFSISLPAAGNNPKAIKIQKKPDLLHEGKILIIDDDEMILRITSSILKKSGFEVASSLNGSDALDIFKLSHKNGSPFDCVLIDLTIPGSAGGKELVNLFRKIDPEISAVITSGYTNDPVMVNFSDYNFSAALPKPYKKNDLIETLSHLIIQRFS